MNIDTKTKICCIIGNPVVHSLSPAMHNAAYKTLELNFCYQAFRVDDIKNAISGIRALGIRGASVTVPHKINVMQYLDEIDETAKSIGAVNTIVNNNGKLIGYNTDSFGAMQALEEKISLKNKKVVLIGAGGAAHAIGFGLKTKGANILILNRDIEKAKALANKVGADFGNLLRLSEIKNSNILIHATPTGMSPDIDKSLIPNEYLNKNLSVFDIVYNPKETKLLQDAKLMGCTIIYGYKMLLYQAVSQFQLFTGKKAPVNIMEKVLVSSLKKNL